MDAPCKVQGSIHVFHLMSRSMCPGFWVHIKVKSFSAGFYISHDSIFVYNNKAGIITQPGRTCSDHSLLIDCHYSCVIDSQELIQSGNLGMLFIFSFTFFFQDIVIDNIVFRCLMALKHPHDFVSDLPESR